jgi:hypothetical protein
MSVDEEALMWVEKYRPKNLDEIVDQTGLHLVSK